MLSSPKAIGDAIFSAAAMTSFAVPGAGPVLAAGVAGLQAIFDIFYSDSGPTDPGDMVVTANELSQAVEDIKAAIDDGNLKSELDKRFTKVTDLYKRDLAPSWSDAAAGKGPAFVGDMSKTEEDDWVKTMTTKLQDPITGSTDLTDAITFIEQHPSKKYDSLPLYIYAVTAYILFCKINVMWQYARIVRANDFAKVMADKANAANAAAYRAWLKGGKQGPEPKLAPPVEALLPKDKIQEQSQYVKMIHDMMDKEAIPYLEGIIDDLQKEFMDAHQELNARGGQISLMPSETAPEYIMDNGTGQKLDLNRDQTLPTAIDDPGISKMRMDAYLGGIRAEIYFRRISSQGLGDFTVPVRLQHKAILKHWKQCRDNALKFLQDYPVPPNG